MKGEFSGKTLYLSQAQGALGMALACHFANLGANLVLGRASDDVRAACPQALCMDCDLNFPAEIDAMLQAAQARFGGVDICIYNDDCVQRCTLQAVSMDSFWQQFCQNARGAFFLAQRGGAHMAARGQGKLLIISSIHGDKPTGSTPIYSVAKGSLKMLTRECALQLGRQGIQTNLIELGGMVGDDARFGGELSALYYRYAQRMPAACATPQELTDLAAFLVGSHARHINGAIVRADGGFLYNYGVRRDGGTKTC